MPIRTASRPLKIAAAIGLAALTPLLTEADAGARVKFFTPHEILKQAISENAELFKLGRIRHPYRNGNQEAEEHLEWSRSIGTKGWSLSKRVRWMARS